MYRTPESNAEYLKTKHQLSLQYTKSFFIASKFKYHRRGRGKK
jgi:hypothetical protein